MAAWLVAPLLLAGPRAAGAQVPGDTLLPEPVDSPSTGWDVTLARGETREIAFTTDEGTWLSVDLSPDGAWVLFDLLGHIYRVPASGGPAESLTQGSGVAVNYHPSWSPDGRHIAFISDRGGQNNLWVMDADGADPRAVFESDSYRASMPVWTPDGEYIVVRRDYVGTGRGGTSGLWMYHRDGGEGVELLEERAARWPSVSPDGRHVYFHVDEGSDALAGDFQIRRLDLRTGETLDVTAGGARGAAAGRLSSGGAFAPEVSPDGRWLAFGRQIPDGTVSFRGHRFGPRTALWLRDLETGAERVLMDPISVAIESGSKSLGILPGYGWSRDGRSIVISQGGKIRRVDVASGQVTTIPFDAPVRRTISEMAYRAFRIDDGPFTSTFLRWPTASPDGRTLAFQGVGRVWTVPRSGGTPRRVTPESFEPFEYAPAWSPDGRWLAFTTWEDTLGGHVWRVRAGGGRPERLTRTPGEYVHPMWSPDGRELVVARGSGATARGRTLTHNPWWDVVRIPAGGGDATLVERVATGMVARGPVMAPSWGPEGRIFFPAREGEGGDARMALVSVRQDGTDRRVHLTFPDADEIVPSPDGRRVAFQEGDNVYVTALPMMGTAGEPVALEKRRGSLPVTQVSRTGGLFPRWRDARTLEFGSAARYFSHDVEAETTDTVEIRLVVPRRVPRGSVALTGARIIALQEGREVIERGTIVVDGARIRCVGECDTAGVDRVIDATGTTIMPGLIDMHSHHYREHRGYRPSRDYELAIYLAYGVTTSLDNSMWSQNIFPTAELIEAGEMIGPRTYSTGDPLYRGEGSRQNDLTSYEVTEQSIERLQSWGAVSLKQYQQPRREQRQWVSDVARRKGLMVTAEGGDLFYNLGMIMDGQTGWEHPLSYLPIHRDVATFFGRAGAYYSPTFVVAGPGPWNIDYFFGESDVWRDPKQRRWMPWRMLAGHLRRRTLRPETDYSYPILAEGLADIMAEGGHGAIGSHGEHHGTAAHWEVWMAAEGLGNLGALRLATLEGARMLGAHADLGTLEPGKLADLLVLEANPLDDIRATLRIRHVMKGGILYEADTLDEVWPERRPFGPYYWVDEDALRSDDRAIDWHERRP